MNINIVGLHVLIQFTHITSQRVMLIP